MAIILRSPDYEDVDSQRLVFLGGPIQGASDWQKEAIRFLLDNLSDRYTIASPRSLRTIEEYYGQMEWEHYHLQRAHTIFFWLPCPLSLSFSERLRVLFSGIPPRPYAQTMWFELGWFTCYCRHFTDKVNLVVGMEHGFPNGRYITHVLNNKDFSKKIPIEEDLTLALKKTLHILKS